MRARIVHSPRRLRLLPVPLVVLALAGLTGCGTEPTTPSATTSTSAAGALRACDLVSAADAGRAAQRAFGDGSASDSDRRSVCTFTAADGTGLTVGLEPADRFDAKADAARRSAGVPGAALPGLGEQALFFYSDADLPTGVGGVVVRGSGAAVDITLQGLGGEAVTRDAAIGVAQLALARATRS